MTTRAAAARTAIVVALIAALAACGRKGPPIAPELVHPGVPEDLAAIATPAGIRLTWQRPMRYSGGQRMNDLGGFTIERATVADDGVRGPFAQVGKVELTDQTRFRKERRIEWTDAEVSRGTLYVYRVHAYTLDGYTSAPAGPAAVRFGSANAEPPPAEPHPAKPQSKEPSP